MITEFSGEYRFLSNFYPALVTYRTPHGGAFEFRTVEHAFQACKAPTRLECGKILAAASPAEAKRLGRAAALTPAMLAAWDDCKKQVMLELVTAKFTRHPELRTRLAATGDQLLVEGNTWHDNYWGQCICQKCIAAYAPAIVWRNWDPASFATEPVWTRRHRGANYLGKILMAVREIVKVDR